MELGAELQKKRFITLVPPEYDLHINEAEEFVGPKIRIPAMGRVCLTGSRQFDYYTDKDLGIAIIDDRVVIKKANDLKSMGLFHIFVDIESLGAGDTSMACIMAVSKDTSLESNVEIDDDSGNIPEEIRYGGFTTPEGWKLKGDNRKFVFFAPADPKFLSQLQFSFNQTSNLPESAK